MRRNIPASLLCAVALWSAESTPLFEAQTRELTAEQAKTFLPILCPGHVATEYVGGHNTYGCDVCPAKSGMAGDASAPGKIKWTVQATIAGHFTASGAEEVVLGVSGCEAHVNNFGGTTLLAKAGGEWKMSWYHPGLITTNCRKIALSGNREILFCEDTYTGSGVESHSLYTADLQLAEDKRFHRLLGLEDTMGACFAGAELRKARIVSVQFPDLNGDKIPDLRVIVEVGLTKKFTEAEIAKLCPSNLPTPKMQKLTLDFLFQGSEYAPTAASKTILKQFEP